MTSLAGEPLVVLGEDGVQPATSELALPGEVAPVSLGVALAGAMSAVPAESSL